MRLCVEDSLLTVSEPRDSICSMMASTSLMICASVAACTLGMSAASWVVFTSISKSSFTKDAACASWKKADVRSSDAWARPRSVSARVRESRNSCSSALASSASSDVSSTVSSASSTVSPVSSSRSSPSSAALSNSLAELSRLSSRLLADASFASGSVVESSGAGATVCCRRWRRSTADWAAAPPPRGASARRGLLELLWLCFCGEPEIWISPESSWILATMAWPLGGASCSPLREVVHRVFVVLSKSRAVNWCPLNESTPMGSRAAKVAILNTQICPSPATNKLPLATKSP
mmetsp:Transcript_38578/g.83895  ORF Transcript_38578/g.83895 Transcript_38578/m.83895 type:complete len:292 (+) Transcript_38578:439-1314(+)